MLDGLLARWIKAAAPSSILICADDPRPFSQCPENLAAAAYSVCTPQQVLDSTSMPRYDLGVIIEPITSLNDTNVNILPSRFRDLLTNQFWVVLPKSGYEENRLVSMGLYELPDSDPANITANWKRYGYNIQNYKTTPEWLNSHGWAHPERFGKHFW